MDTAKRSERPIWRSMLFVPAHVEKYIASAHLRGADACILDLEDSVPLAEKARARAMLADSVQAIGRSGVAVIVRINSESTGINRDLFVATLPQVSAIMLPKAESADDVQAVDAKLSQLETERSIAIGAIGIIAQIESVHALARIDEIAGSSRRLIGLILGSEDFSVSAGAEPCTETLLGPNQQVLFACRRAGILPFGFPGSISVFRDLDAFRNTIRLARRMGFVGSYAIHPDQVRVMNEEFVPPADEVVRARELLAANEASGVLGRGAFEFRGRMVDPPVVAQARETLRRASRSSINSSEGSKNV